MAHLTPLTEEEQTLKTLRRIFHEQMSLMELHNYNTKEKMINMLNTMDNNEWTAEYISKLAIDNKIDWVHGLDDPCPYDIYKKQMNTRLAEILS